MPIQKEKWDGLERVKKNTKVLVNFSTFIYDITLILTNHILCVSVPHL